MGTFYQDLFWKKAERGVNRKIQKMHSAPTISVGVDTDTGKDLSMLLEEMASTHTYVLGGSGAGKTKFLEGLCRQIVKKGYGLCVLDGKAGETCLYENLASYCTRFDLEDFGSARERLSGRTILIDPTDDNHSVGINYLELLGDADPDTLAGWVLEAIKKFFNESDETKVWFEEWGHASIVPLIKARFTLVELSRFVSLQEPEFREAILSQIGDGEYARQWAELRIHRPTEQTKILGAVRTRANLLRSNPILKSIFGQAKTSVDWLKVMSEGGAVLAKLGSTPKLPERVGRLIGTAILHQISSVASLRPANQRRPFFFVVDEFQRFVTPDFADALERLREYGISLILSHQHREQFEKEAPEVLSSIDSCCMNKIVFNCRYEDAQSMVGELYSGMLHKGAEEVKDEIIQTKFRPVKKYEDVVTESQSENTGLTNTKSSSNARGTTRQGSRSLGEGETNAVGLANTKGKVHTRSSGYSYGTSRSRSSSFSWNEILSPDLKLTVGSGGSVSDSSGESEGYFSSESESDIDMETRSRSKAINTQENITKGGSKTATHTKGGSTATQKGRSESTSVTHTPVMESEEYKELTSRTFYGLDEVKERHTAEIKNQPKRHAQWKLFHNEPLQIKTHTIEAVHVPDSAQHRFSEKSHALHAKLRDDVEREIEERVPRYLKLVAASEGVEPEPEDALE